MTLIRCPDCGTDVSDAAAACPKCARPIASRTDVPAGRQVAAKSKNVAGGFVLLVFVCLGLWIYSQASSNNDPTEAKQENSVPQQPAGASSVFGAIASTVGVPSEPEPEQDQETAASLPLADASLAKVIQAVKPQMGDTTNSLSEGAAKLAMWAASSHLSWKELNTTPKTKSTLVMKDSDAERGKLICTTGTIVEIAAEDAAGEKLFQGELGDENGSIYRFIAVRSTGDLIEQSTASFCGVVIGRFDYGNSMGGVSHAIQLVGMFRLPENLR